MFSSGRCRGESVKVACCSFVSCALLLKVMLQAPRVPMTRRNNKCIRQIDFVVSKYCCENRCACFGWFGRNNNEPTNVRKRPCFGWFGRNKEFYKRTQKNLVLHVLCSSDLNRADQTRGRYICELKNGILICPTYFNVLTYVGVAYIIQNNPWKNIGISLFGLDRVGTIL